jgi:CRP/FNR family transcriptional regulator, cyclic AMP receptor protein
MKGIIATAGQEVRRALEAAAVPKRLRPGEILFQQGDPGHALYIIDRGEIEISVQAFDGRKLALDILREGETFGEIALLGGARTATATAIGDCTLRAIRRTDFLAALRREPDLAIEFIEVLCARLRSLSSKLEERSFLPVPVRLANRLLHLDLKLGGTGRVQVSQTDLADFVGATREGVAKTLATWRARDWIAVSRGAIRITNRAELERLGEEFRETSPSL